MNGINGVQTSGQPNRMNGIQRDVEQDVLEPIAVIGLALKFPQNATSPELFWKMIIEKECAATEFPSDRMNIDAFHDSGKNKLNKISTRIANFLKEDFRAFDSTFFSMPSVEAGTLDPQARGLLETTYHALENAGLPIEKLAGSSTSVHVGSFTNDFTTLSWRDLQQIPKYSATSSSASLLSNRLSWFYDFRGPSMSIDTACSSSMVALSLACDGLWSGKTEMAVVAGSNIILSPELNIVLSNMNFLSPNGRCYSFDHRGNGYARGEGFGVIVLKSLSQAVKDGDNIRALIRATGTNQDGYTSGGITQPSKDMQSSLIKETYAKAGLEMSKTRFFEAHGTGTAIGDPIEARAIGESFRSYRSAEEPLYVGAVKSNVGHLEGASGMAGVIKTILALEKGVIPPNTNFESLNPQIDEEFLNLKFPTECVPWPTTGVRRASVNSFGYGGANAHIVIDDAYHYQKLRNIQGKHSTAKLPPKPCSLIQGSELAASHLYQSEEIIGPRLLVWSASDETGMARLVKSYEEHFSQIRNVITSDFLDDLEYTLDLRRSSLAWKSYAVINSTSILENLQQVISKPVRSITEPGLGFVFTGQGAQWYAMGRELLVCSIFKESLSKSSDYLHLLGCEWSLIDELSKSKSATRVNDPEFSQTMCTAIQIALVDLLEYVGVIPLVVVGHSSGEIGAAYCAGYLSHKSSIKVAYHRGVLASKLVKESLHQNTMISVGLSESQVISRMRDLAQASTNDFDANLMTISCINSPQNVTISGPNDQVATLATFLEHHGIFARKLVVQLGYHSPQMLEISAEYLESLGNLESGSKLNKTRMMSSVTCKIVSAEVVRTGQYWVENMVSPVNFLEAMRLCCSRASKDDILKRLDGSHANEVVTNAWLEVGPHAALKGPIRDILKSVHRSSEVTYTATLVRNHSATESILEAAGRLHCQNFPIQISKLALLTSNSTHLPQVLSDIPQYSFNHSIIQWEESQKSKAFRFRKFGNHPLLGSQVGDWNPLEARWTFTIKAEELPWIHDHKVNGSILYPAAGMLVMAIEATKMMVDGSPIGFELTNVEIPSPILITGSPVDMQLTLQSSAMSNGKTANGYRFRLHLKKANDDWEEVCHGSVRADFGRKVSDVDSGKEEHEITSRILDHFDKAKISCNQTVESAKMYQQFKEDIGIEYGPTFQALDAIHFNENGEALATLIPSKWSDEAAMQLSEDENLCVIHPTVLDGIFQLPFVALSEGGSKSIRTMVPTRIGSLWLSASGAGNSHSSSEQVLTDAHFKTQRSANCSIFVVDQPSKQLRVRLEDLEATAVSGNQDSTQNVQEMKKACFHMEWKPDLDLLTPADIQSYSEENSKGAPEPIKFFTDIELLALSFGAQALKQLDTRRAHPIPSLQKYVSWFRVVVEQYLSAEPVEESRQRATQLYDPDHLELLCREMLKSKRGTLFVKVGRDLSEILRGEIEPLQLLFEDEQLYADFYQEINGDSEAFEVLSRYLDPIIHKNPGLKFLEIGAGTGATTNTILKTLAQHDGIPLYGEYAFTDISPSFFEKAMDSFSTQRRMKFQVLDIEEDPCTQGFQEAEYDVLIATSVLHATKNLDETIRHARKLLKTGGKLIFMEMTVPNVARNGYVFGLLPGWWRGSEEHRQSSPCVTEQQWNEVLLRNGFAGTELVFRDYESDVCHQWSIMVSTAISTESVSPSIPGAILVMDLASTTQRALNDELSRQLNALKISTATITLEDVASIRTHGENHYIILNEVERPILYNIEPKSFSALQVLCSSAGSILWVSAGGGSQLSTPDYGLIQGLFRVSHHENHNVPLVQLALQDAATSSLTRNVAHITTVFCTTASKLSSGDTFEPEYREVDSLLHINRLVEASYLNKHMFSRTSEQIQMKAFGAGPPVKLAVRTPGLLDSLEFREDLSALEPLAPDEAEIEVKAIGVNFKECLTVLGRVDTDTLGSECSGIIRRVGTDCGDFRVNDRVALCALDTYKSHVRAQVKQIMKIPDHVTFADAASLPMAASTVYYSLCEVARLQKGESILIHAASGGTGQAAIQLASHIGAEIYATVGSLPKKKLLMENYGIAEDHIFYSRDTSFSDGIKRMTKNRGVDVVLNSLSGEGLIASWECIAFFGRFVEIGRKDIDSRGFLPMYPFIKNASFCGVDLTYLLSGAAIGPLVWKNTVSLIKDGTIRPVYPVHSYNISQLEEAFRFLQTGQSSGKIVVEIDNNAIVPKVSGPNSNYKLNKHGTYLIAGGLGGLGRSIARWLVHRGAVNLILLSRSGPNKNPRASELLQELKSKGARVECPLCDIADLESLQRILAEYAGMMPPIKGCIQASMVLRDANFAEMSRDSWRQSTLPKVQGSWNLHSVLPKGLEFFVMLSSVCGVFGNGGQSNYAAGNTYQDALAEYRVSHGEKALSLDLGIALSEGFVAEDQDMMDRLLRLKLLLPVSQKELFALLDFYCNPGLELPQNPLHSQVITGLELPANILEKGGDVPSHMMQPLFRIMHQMESSSQYSTKLTQQAQDLKSKFIKSSSIIEAGAVVSEALRAKLSRVMGIPLDDIDLQHRMESYGVDSLLAVELRNWLAKEVGADMAVFEILGGATLVAIGLTAATKSKFKQASWSEQ